MSEKSVVSVSACPDYDIEKVRKAVNEAVERLGGMGKFVKPGEKVLLKVNLLFPSEPSEAVTTHPAVVKAVIELVEKAGGHAIVGDSPGLAFSKARLEKTYKKCQMYEAIERTKAELNWNTDSVVVQNPGGKLMKSLEVIKILEEVDRVIALPKPKTHSFTVYTGATKVLYGVMPGLVKAAYHSKLPDKKDFCEMLLDIQEYVKTDLFIMDAIVGMDGKGPSGGNARKVGAILASSDALAMDVVACSMVGIDPLSVPTISNGVGRGLTTGKLGDVDVVGTEPKKFPWIKFEPAMKANIRIPKFIMRYVGNRFTKKPVPDPARCIGCGACVMGCHKHCITLVGRKARVNSRECIRCYCCHELCPERAIDLK
ncbi:MAG: DUF362 domain-containing protein [Candidatus Thermoplasmatota archaeon]|nr:DUF362 domain-containing protein [Euryarchaeota archaeon]MBU4032657.1 DUF362 domain-containing protein [Candidatus Thermoplasmatota archaeon]MBU4071861.1 DUF362 domain-containing protein [Candidatus Thermoplasmatota archaeon]MBU4144020.1 DUF362 domain-containing protein [Candidatus Thermoplasmatota archaeon]MBU4591866.1 DUF362 domain-containing protein [Candidatus Thermoplasmatota archaeon]